MQQILTWLFSNASIYETLIKILICHFIFKMVLMSICSIVILIYFGYKKLKDKEQR